jgi:hypothetical protein
MKLQGHGLHKKANGFSGYTVLILYTCFKSMYNEKVFNPIFAVIDFNSPVL